MWYNNNNEVKIKSNQELNQEKLEKALGGKRVFEKCLACEKKDGRMHIFCTKYR